MKSKKSIVALFLIFTILLTAAACSGKGDKEAETEMQDTAAAAEITQTAAAETQAVNEYTAQTIELPESIDSISQLVAQDGRIYFYYTYYSENEEEYYFEDRIASVKEDGSDFREFSYERADEDSYIMSMTVDKNGDIWVAEGYRTVETDGNISACRLKRFDEDGKAIATHDVESLSSTAEENFTIYGMTADAQGNIYLNIGNDNTYKAAVLDDEGGILCTIETENYIDSFVTAEDGGMLALLYEDDICVFRKIDLEQGAFGESTSLGEYYDNACGDTGSYIYLDDGTDLYRYELSTGEKTGILNWKYAGVSASSVEQLACPSDGRFIISVTNSDTFKSELILISCT